MKFRKATSLLLILVILVMGASISSCSDRLFARKVKVTKPKRHIFPYNQAKHKYKKRTRTVKYTSH